MDIPVEATTRLTQERIRLQSVRCRLVHSDTIESLLTPKTTLRDRHVSRDKTACFDKPPNRSGPRAVLA